MPDLYTGIRNPGQNKQGKRGAGCSACWLNNVHHVDNVIHRCIKQCIKPRAASRGTAQRYGGSCFADLGPMFWRIVRGHWVIACSTGTRSHRKKSMTPRSCLTKRGPWVAGRGFYCRNWRQLVAAHDARSLICARVPPISGQKAVKKGQKPTFSGCGPWGQTGDIDHVSLKYLREILNEL